VEELQQRRRRVLDDFGCESLLPGFLGGLAWDALRGRLVQLMGDEGDTLANRLVGGLDGDTTIEQNELLFAVAGGKKTLDDFLERFGHRCMGEMELSLPRWREDPACAQQMVALMKTAPERNPAQMHERKRSDRLAAEAELPARLRYWGGSSFREEIERDLRDAQRLLPYREIGKHYLMMGYELLRLATEELGRRWQLGTDVYFLQLEELPEFTTGRAERTPQLVQRRERWQTLQRLEAADVVDSLQLDQLGLHASRNDGAHEFSGTCLSNGVADGSARVVRSPQEAVGLGVDYVLVCPSTDPGWTPLFVGARALVMERGGVLSHGAIVARDFGIPAVVCPNATRLLGDGDRVRVDANRGRIVVLTKTEHARVVE
jgi:pyruvate,water dikinase